MGIRKVGPEPPAWILCWDSLMEKNEKGREIEGKKIGKIGKCDKLCLSHLLGYFAGTA